MNAEFADVDATGHQDLYVTNISLGRLRNGMNIFWKNKGDGRFENQANDYGIGRCGFAWGAKFLDVDHDGYLDLFVVSGNQAGQQSIWFPLLIWGMVPNFLKASPLIAKEFPKNGEYAGRQQKCFFWRHNGRFLDVADAVGLGDKGESRSVALIDLDNSGNTAVLTGNFRGPPVSLYRPVLKIKNHWIGFNLVGSTSNRDAFGAKISLIEPKNSYTKEIYPGNVVAAQSDKRAVFGLGKDTAPVTAEVWWPSGTHQKISGLAPDSYHTIVEP